MTKSDFTPSELQRVRNGYCPSCPDLTKLTRGLEISDENREYRRMLAVCNTCKWGWYPPTLDPDIEQEVA